jgi:two-component system sensor histidine kinase EvgS
VLILFVIFGIVYIWLNEQNRQQELEATTYKIRSLRKDVHEVYMKVVDLSMIGETVLDWNEEDIAAYHEKRLEVDSLLSRFKSRTCRSERIDSICQLLAEKEKLLNRIMLVLYEQEEIKEKIARHYWMQRHHSDG